eukprot:scaffold203190_cov27-Tisochrysis_lutea.AAC.3
MPPAATISEKLVLPLPVSGRAISEQTSLMVSGVPPALRGRRFHASTAGPGECIARSARLTRFSSTRSETPAWRFFRSVSSLFSSSFLALAAEDTGSRTLHSRANSSKFKLPLPSVSKPFIVIAASSVSRSMCMSASAACTSSREISPEKSVSYL